MFESLSKLAEGVVTGLSRRGFLGEVGDAAAKFAGLFGGALALGSRVNQQAVAAGCNCESDSYQCCYYYCENDGSWINGCAINGSCPQFHNGCRLSPDPTPHAGCDCGSCGKDVVFTSRRCCQYYCDGVPEVQSYPAGPHNVCSDRGFCPQTIYYPGAPRTGVVIPGSSRRKFPICRLQSSPDIGCCDECPEV